MQTIRGNPTAERLGFIELAPGVRRRHVLSYLFAALVSIGLFTFITTLSPYVFRVNLGVPVEAQGRLQGSLQFWQEIATLLTIGLWGALSDRLGRRPIYIGGFVLVALAYALYPFAGGTSQLFFARVVFGVAVAALSAMLATLLADYPAESSRGKLVGLAFFLNGIGAVVFFALFARLPQWFSDAAGPVAAGPLWAGRYAFLVVVGIALIGAIVMFGLKAGRPLTVKARLPLAQLLREGVLAARNPRIALAYGGAVAARGDMAIITLFLQLWAVNLGMERGLSAADATARGGGMVVGIAMGTAVLWSIVFGFLGDRWNRLTITVLAFGFATLGYGWIAMTEDVLAPEAIPALILLGIGQSSAILATTLLLGQEAPAELRGSVFGVQSFCGALAILAISIVGGWAFDAVGPQAPFWIMASVNAVLWIWAAALRWTGHGASEPLGARSSDLGRSP